MLSKLLICPFFGNLPEFYPQWRESVRTLEKYGYDVLIETDLEAFNQRCEKVLGFRSSIVAGTGKLWDYRCAFGELFEAEIADYDFWGHTDFDVVYGNPENFMPDPELEKIDIISDEKNYVGGHWTLYRNCPSVNHAFRKYPRWKEIMLDPHPSGWVEREYTQAVEALDLRIRYQFVQASRDNGGLKLVDGNLYQHGREVMLAHFKDQKRWPL